MKTHTIERLIASDAIAILSRIVTLTNQQRLKHGRPEIIADVIRASWILFFLQPLAHLPVPRPMKTKLKYKAMSQSHACNSNRWITAVSTVTDRTASAFLQKLEKQICSAIWRSNAELCSATKLSRGWRGIRRLPHAGMVNFWSGRKLHKSMSHYSKGPCVFHNCKFNSHLCTKMHKIKWL